MLAESFYVIGAFRRNHKKACILWLIMPHKCTLFLCKSYNSRMPRHSCCEVRVMQLHDILLLRTSAILPEAISAGGLTPTTDTSLLLTTYRGGSHLPADIQAEII